MSTGAIATESLDTAEVRESAKTTPPNASLLSLFWSFFKIGAFTFGGGWAMVPLIRKELVSRRGWLQDLEFVDLLAVAQSAPGPIAINTSIITGYKIRKVPGALVSVLGAALPSFLVILAFATVLLRFKGSSVINAVFTGMRPAIFGLLISAVWQLAKTSVKTRVDAGFAAVAAALLLAFKLNPIVVVAAAAVAGVALGRFSASKAGTPASSGGTSKTPPGDRSESSPRSQTMHKEGE